MQVDRTIALGLTIALIAGISATRNTSGASAFDGAAIRALQSGALAIEYKTILSTRITRDNNRLVLLISIAPADFERERMIALSSQLKKDFSNEPLLLAMIFDSETAARNYLPAGGSYDEAVKLERGQYELNRTSGRESIIYSTKRGNPITEVQIDLQAKEKRQKKKSRNRVN